jgi:hypothetical protein
MLTAKKKGDRRGAVQRATPQPRARRKRLAKSPPENVQAIINKQWTEVESELNHELFLDILECVGQCKCCQDKQKNVLSRSLGAARISIQMLRIESLCALQSCSKSLANMQGFSVSAFIITHLRGGEGTGYHKKYTTRIIKTEFLHASAKRTRP